MAMILSLLRVVRHSYRPHTGVFVVGEGDAWQLVPAIPGAVTEPGLVIFASEQRSSIQCQPVRRGGSRLGSASSSVRALAGRRRRSDHECGLLAARMVRQLHQELIHGGVVLVLARVSASLKADLDRHLLTEVIGAARFFRPPARCAGGIRRTQRPTSTNGVRESISIRIDLASNVLRAGVSTRPRSAVWVIRFGKYQRMLTKTAGHRIAVPKQRNESQNRHSDPSAGSRG